MKLSDLNKEYDRLQATYGATELHSIYNGGCEKNPEICFVFMNPTGKNIAAYPEWTGIHSPWVGTKNIWDLFVDVNVFDKHVYAEIKNIRGSEWTPEFAEHVYKSVKNHKLFITNLAKCTQIDAKPIPNKVYKQYLPLLEKEIEIIQPKVVILFGNQVSSVFLGKNISVSKSRKTVYHKEINGTTYECFPVYYPVGNGRCNIGKAIEDIKWIIETRGLKC